MFRPLQWVLLCQEEDAREGARQMQPHWIQDRARDHGAVRFLPLMKYRYFRTTRSILTAPEI